MIDVNAKRTSGGLRLVYDEWAIGKEVYYREGLKESKHELEVPLQPDRAYYWSVRVRRGGDVSDWARFEFTRFQPYKGRVKTEFPFFMFKTPSK